MNCHEVTDELLWLCRTDDLRSRHLAENFGFTYVKTFLQAEHGLESDFYHYTLKLDSDCD